MARQEGKKEWRREIQISLRLLDIFVTEIIESRALSFY